MTTACGLDITTIRSIEEQLWNANQQTKDIFNEFIEIEFQDISCLQYYNKCHILFPEHERPISVFAYLSKQDKITHFFVNTYCGPGA